MVEAQTVPMRANGATDAPAYTPTDFTIRASERTTVVGKTGSGKTVWCQRLLAPATRLVVCDAKGKIARYKSTPEWRLRDWDEGKAELIKGKPARLCIPPPLTEDAWDDLFWQLYKIPNITVYIDELSSAGRANGGPGIRALYTRGREFNIGVVSSVQRPAGIPLITLSEAEVFVLFRLQVEADVKRMTYLMGPQAGRPMEKYHWLFFRDDMERPVYCEPIPL